MATTGSGNSSKKKSTSMSSSTSSGVQGSMVNVIGPTGVEYSTWLSKDVLVTVHETCVRFYKVVKGMALVRLYGYENIQGSICSVHSLSHNTLLFGYAGRGAQLSLVTPTSTILRASCLVDLTDILLSTSISSSSSQQEVIDMQTSIYTTANNTTAMVCVILGGGLAVVIVEFTYHEQQWQCRSKPYSLPLHSLQLTCTTSTTASTTTTNTSSSTNATTTNANNASNSVSHGFGTILDTCWISQEIVILLHSVPGGPIWTGRLNSSSKKKSTNVITAISIRTNHNRSVVLWSIPTPSNCTQIQYSCGKLFCKSVNSLAVVEVQRGHVVTVLGVNGWCISTSIPSFTHTSPPSGGTSSTTVLQTNPYPLPTHYTNVILDGPPMTLLKENIWIIPTKNGSLYVLEYHTNIQRLSLLPLRNKQLDTVGMISSTCFNKDGGYFFVSSRLGNSHLFHLPTANITKVSLASLLNKNMMSSSPSRRDSKRLKTNHHNDDVAAVVISDDEEEEMLQKEEEELYYGTTTTITTTKEDLLSKIPLSNDDNYENNNGEEKKYRVVIEELSVVLKFQCMDTLVGLGPVGPGSGGFFPCGYGSSGGLVQFSAPGSTGGIESDFSNFTNLYSLPQNHLLLTGNKNPTLLAPSNDKTSLEEVTTPSSVLQNVFGKQILHLISHDDATTFVIYETKDDDNNNQEYIPCIIKYDNGTFQLVKTYPPLQQQTQEAQIKSISSCITPTNIIVISCSWSNGTVTLLQFQQNDDDWQMIPSNLSLVDHQKITCTDLFIMSPTIFTATATTHNDTEEKPSVVESNEDEEELYSFTNDENRVKKEEIDLLQDDRITGEHIFSDNEEHRKLYLAISTQSGELQIYDLRDLINSNGEDTSLLVVKKEQAIFVTNGCPWGAINLENHPPVAKEPKDVQVWMEEIKFVMCGPSSSQRQFLTSWNCIIRNNLGDIYVYQGYYHSKDKGLCFQKVPLKLMARPSHLQKRFKNRTAATANKQQVFQNNLFHTFHNLSGQNGLFVKHASRPFWLLNERGCPTIVHHRLRHAAPATAPIMLGFASNSSDGYYTLHARIGGQAQRLTYFAEVLSDVGLTYGSGMFTKKIPLGVTVRRIDFINDASISTEDHPLYVLLISKETFIEAQNTNSIESEEAKRAKEEAKTQRQVEADLGGFDVEQEWVEEIERDDCFIPDTANFGGAPPVPCRNYEVWLVDGAHDNFSVVHTYSLNPQYEHGMTLKVLKLSNILDNDTAANSNNANPSATAEDELFIAVGTGIVEKDGEDVSSKGRIILLSVTIEEDQQPRLSLVYEKPILLGPVTSLTCLVSGSTKRLVVGAGAEITVEQWNSTQMSLTQVGFFHANMQVQEICLLKTFLLVSDAYDSLHFLVWRESDKSLTLLAKDFEPTAVYACGFLSRGSAITFLCHDDQQNIQFFHYTTSSSSSTSGVNQLQCHADFHMGTQTIAFQSHYCKSSLLVHSSTVNSTTTALQKTHPHSSTTADQFGVHFGTTDGGLGTIVPLSSEQVYWRFLALQSVMINAIEPHAGLNPHAWRLYRNSTRRGRTFFQNKKKQVIMDGSLLQQYLDLPLPLQQDLACAIGSTVDFILDNLLELNCSTSIL